MKADGAAKEDTYGLYAWTGPLRTMPQAHRHYELEINYVLRGSLTYLIGGAAVTLPPRRLCALWGAVPHQTLERGTPPEAEVIWVTVPLTQVLAWELPRTLVQRLLRKGCAIEKAEQPGDVAMLGQWIADLKEAPGGGGSGPGAGAMLLELEARLRRMAGRMETGRAAAKQAAEGGKAAEIPAAVEKLARFLAARYREPVAMADAARAAHVHPHYAVTLFRRHTGMTLHGYLTLQRVAHAQRLLATTAQPIVDVALESGFASVSRFYAAFQAQTGRSPRRFRHQFASAGAREKKRGAGRASG